MASFLDLGIINIFSIVFPFLLVFAVVWGILSYAKIFGERSSIQALVAAVVAFMTLMSDTVVQIINTMAPWFVLMIVFILLVMVSFLVFGGEGKDMWKWVRESDYSGTIGWFFFIVSLLIILGSAASVLAKKAHPIVTGEIAGAAAATPAVKAWAILTHPKILGFGVIMVIAIVTVKKLTDVD